MGETVPAAAPAALQVMIPGPQPALDVLGTWQGGSMETMSDLPGQDISEVWRADLPVDLLQAGQILRDQQRGLRAAEHALPQARRLLVEHLADEQGGSGMAFGHGAELPGDTRLDRELRAVLAAARRFDQPGAAFGGDEGAELPLLDLEQVRSRFEQFINQVQRSVGQLALVETLSAGQPVAASRVDWLGNVNTTWSAGQDHQRGVLHSRVLAQALQTRQNWLRFALLLTGGAVRIGASLSAGPFGLLTIWTTWTYVRRVIDEFRRINQLPPAGV